MSEYCKHGVAMAQTCRKCGRVKTAQASDFAARKEGFLHSIDRLEETVRQMQVELARPPLPAAEKPEDPGKPESDPAEPPDPPQRFPWQRG